jgi:hypothetical protein
MDMTKKSPWIRGAVLTVTVAGLASSSAGQEAGKPDGAINAFRGAGKAEQKKREDPYANLELIPAPPGVRSFRLSSELTMQEPEEDEDAGAADARPQGQRLILALENFDLGIFGDDHDEATRQARMEALIAKQLTRAATYNGLSDAQKAKLRVAGRGDVKRFFVRVEEKRRDFDRTRMDTRAGFRMLLQLKAERADYEEGPFGHGSLYEKTLNKVLDEIPGRPRRYPTILDR